MLLEELRCRGIVAPALSTVERLAWEAKRRAQGSVFRKLVAGLDEERLAKLDSLLVVPEGEDETPLNRIRRPPGPPSPKNFKDVLNRLNFVRSLGLEGRDRQALDEVQASPLWQRLPAVQKGQVIEYDAELYYASPLTAKTFLGVVERSLLEGPE
jgi:hypothetical protein